MQFNISGKGLTLLITGLLLGAGFATVYKPHQSPHIRTISVSRNRPKMLNKRVSADSNLVTEVSRADHNYLHKVGNWKAQMANAQAQKLGLPKKYTHDKYGNYWSYLEDHRPIGNDVFDSADVYGNNNITTVTTDSNRHASGIIANEIVLRHHGVYSGINFVHYDNNRNTMNNNM